MTGDKDDDTAGETTLGIATLLGLASALRAALGARMRLARRHAESRLRLALIGAMVGLVGVVLVCLALVFGLHAVALGLQAAGMTPTMSFLATAGGALFAALLLIVIARACIRRALHGPNL